MIGLSQERLEELVVEHVLKPALPPHVVRGIDRSIRRKQLGVLTLEEAARWLRWKSPVALGRALKRFGCDVIKTSPRIVTITVPDLIRFREAHRIKRGRKSPRVKIVRLEQGREAA